MKTVMDAINWFKGGNLLCEFHGSGLEDCDWVLLECLLQPEDCADKVGDICTGGVEFDSGFYRLICDYHSYVVEVALLSRAPWIKGASLEEYQAADKEALKVENKTVEFDGMVYEIGKWYEFSNDKDSWEASKLDAVEGSNFVFRTSLGWMRFCREVKLSVGTITPAPVKLIDGEVYSFTVGKVKSAGIYLDRMKTFTYYGGHVLLSTVDQDSITRLVPEVE